MFALLYPPKKYRIIIGTCSDAMDENKRLFTGKCMDRKIQGCAKTDNSKIKRSAEAVNLKAKENRKQVCNKQSGSLSSRAKSCDGA